ncbi:PREDICTED: transmembrane protein 182 [Cyprinodon variegatus]|uniref:Transmembrane protein 182 n=1 Tax=Cyprinodon variegatus TaxID=28743 RepID=A0A3Q2FHD0_CYPVA|nr:PREDICTED: transmembrane protein 182 [Cyprinodon variegatus]
MKLSVALCFAGVFGALAAVFTFLSFGTDYWLIGSETCSPDSKDSEDNGGLTITLAADVVHDEGGDTISYHSGFFWTCYFGQMFDSNLNKTAAVVFSNKNFVKACYPSYLYPFPQESPTNNTTNDNSAIIYRGFWSVFMLISVATVAIGGFLIICAAPFANHCLYKAGGGLFLTSGFFLLGVVVMHVVWLQALDVIQTYIEHSRSHHCPDFTLTLSYGLSFVFAPIGVLFSFLAGLLFLLIGRTVRIHH